MHATGDIVILAPTSSSLERVAGVPLALRSALCAVRAGFNRIVVFAAASGLRRLSKPRAVVPRSSRSTADRCSRDASAATSSPFSLCSD
jgi:hypothetical protein